MQPEGIARPSSAGAPGSSISICSWLRDLVWRGPELELPHPRFHQRAFALVPAAELVPDWVHPLVGRTIGDLAEEVLRDDPDALISSEPFPVAPTFSPAYPDPAGDTELNHGDTKTQRASRFLNAILAYGSSIVAAEAAF